MRCTVLQRASAGPALSAGKVVGTSIKLPPASKAGKQILYTATTKDGLAFTAGVTYDAMATSTAGHSFLTVTNMNGATPKVRSRCC